VLTFFLNCRIGGFRRRLEVWQFHIVTKTMDISIDSLRLTSSIVSSEANNLITLIFTGKLECCSIILIHFLTCTVALLLCTDQHKTPNAIQITVFCVAVISGTYN
jgi:hypothetical protein